MIQKEPVEELTPESIPSPAPVPVPAPPVQGEAVQADHPAEVSEAPRVPSVAPRPAPLPVEVVTGHGSVGRGRDEGPDLGTVIGVVLRGGRVDPGHCPPRRRPGGIPIRIPRR